MAVRMNPDYAATRFNPTAYGWEPTKHEVQLGEHVSDQDLAGLAAFQNRYGRAELHTWTRGDHVVTLAMIGDWYIHAAVVDGVLVDTDEGIEEALDLLDRLEPAQTTPDDETTPDIPRTYDPAHVAAVELGFQEDAIAAASTSGFAYVCVVSWSSSSDCEPIIAAADDPNLALVRLVQVLAADAQSGHLADHVDETFLAQHPVPQLPDEVDENSPAVFEADSWLTALAECSSEPYVTRHKTHVMTRANDLDPEWGLTRAEVATLIKLAAISVRELDTIGTGTDYDAADLALDTFGHNRGHVQDLARRAFSRVVEGVDVA